MSRIDHNTTGATDRPAGRCKMPGPDRGRLVRFLRLFGLAMIFVLALALLGVTGLPERLFYLPSRGPTPVPRHLIGAEKVTFASEDGTQLVAWFIPCQKPDCDPSNAPTIVHAHGNAGSLPTHLGFSQHLPEAGFNLLLFDYRGYGESEGTARRRGPLIADTHAAFDWVSGQVGLTGPIGVFGQSLGGALALNVMATRTDIDAAVIVSVFSSWRDMAADAVLLPRPVSTWLASLLISDCHRPMDAIAKVDRPVLLMHGTGDRIVPPHHSRLLRDAATADGVELLEMPAASHNDIHLVNPDFIEQSIAFFRKHLQ